MKYEFDFPYEIKTCQTCPFMRLYKGSTHCAFAPYGEQRSIRYGTCPLRVAGWHTGTPTEEGWYLMKVKLDDEIVYDTNYLTPCVYGMDWRYAHEEILKWQKLEEEEDGKCSN